MTTWSTVDLSDYVGPDYFESDYAEISSSGAFTAEIKASTGWTASVEGVVTWTEQ